MILGTKKIKSVTVSIVSLSICHEVMGPDAMILDFFFLSCKDKNVVIAYFFAPSKIII